MEEKKTTGILGSTLKQTFKQIKEVPDSYLAVDDTEIGHKNRIPLWLFGMLYWTTQEFQ